MQGIKPVGEAYPAYSHIINSHGPSAATSEARIRALRSVPAEDLLQSHNETNRFGGINLTIEQGSGAIWTEATLDRLRRGEHDPWIEAVILGTTEDEGTMFTLGMRLNTPQGFDGYTKNLPEALQSRVRERYLGGQPHPETVSLIDAPATKLLSDQLFADPVYNQALAMASQPNKCRTWVYRCRATVVRPKCKQRDYDCPADAILLDQDRISKNDVAECGAMHCIELPFVFNTASLWDGKADAHEAKSAAVFGSTWARFAIGGNPDPNWQPFDPNSPSWFVFESGGQTDNESLESYAASRIDFSKRSDGEDEGGDTLGVSTEWLGGSHALNMYGALTFAGNQRIEHEASRLPSSQAWTRMQFSAIITTIYSRYPAQTQLKPYRDRPPSTGFVQECPRLTAHSGKIPARRARLCAVRYQCRIRHPARHLCRAALCRNER